MNILRSVISAVALSFVMSMPCFADITIEGVQVKETMIVDGVKLVLNGAGYRKRAYGKFNVQALYLEEKKKSIQAITQASGVKRIAVIALRDVPNQTAARHFIADLDQTLTENERKTLINEVGMLGSVFVGLHRIAKGDVVTIDWLPGKGVLVAINGRPLPFPDGSNFLDNEAIYNILLRVHLGPALPEELQKNMLGESRSMEDKPA